MGIPNIIPVRGVSLPDHMLAKAFGYFLHNVREAVRFEVGTHYPRVRRHPRSRNRSPRTGVHRSPDQQKARRDPMIFLALLGIGDAVGA